MGVGKCISGGGTKRELCNGTGVGTSYTVEVMAVQVREWQQVEYKFVFPLLTSFVVSMHGYRLGPVHVVSTFDCMEGRG